VINVLSAAFDLLPHEKVELLRPLKKEINAAGLYEISYNLPQLIDANIQPVPMAIYGALNLDFAKKYFYIHTLFQLASIDTQCASDRIRCRGKLYEVHELSEWFAIYGWTKAMMVEVQ
jgi:hypothetical protein